jgi:hypothetical protein
MGQVIVEQETWPQHLGELVVQSVGPTDGPIMLYAEDDIGLAMATSVIFERNGQLVGLEFEQLDGIGIAVQELYARWGGPAGDIRGLLFVIRGREFSARFIYLDTIDPNKTMHDRTLGHIHDVFGREWVPPREPEQNQSN